MDSLFSELRGFSSLILWTLLPPVLTPTVAKIYTKVRRWYNPAFDTQTRDLNYHRRICRVATLSIILLGVFVHAIFTHQKSLFLEMGFKNGCQDPKIKSEYRKFLKSFHPDKIGVVDDAFIKRKLLFDAIKDEDKCIKYDIFGIFNVGDKAIDRSEKECFEHYMMESLVFYMMSFTIFFGFSFTKDINSSIEPIVIFVLALIFDLDGVIYYRNGMIGKLLAPLAKIFGVISIFEFRTFMRSIIFNVLIYVRHLKQTFSRPKISPAEKHTLLLALDRKCDLVMEKLTH